MNAVSPPNSAALGAGLPYLPVFLDVRDRVVLLISGGEGAASKLDLLLQTGARVRLVASRHDRLLEPWHQEDVRIELVLEPLTARHFEGAVVAIDASGDPEINRLAQSLSRAAGIPLNVVDRPELCNFVFPAILNRAPVIVAVSTGGLAPAVARLIRQRLETAIPAGIGQVAMLAGRLRSAVAARLSSYGQSAIFWERLFDGDAGRMALSGRIDDAATLAESLIAELEVEPPAPGISVVDVASDDPELLTLRAARLLRMADLIIYDPAVSGEVLALGRRDARRIALDLPDTSNAALEQISRRQCRHGNIAVYLRASLSPQGTNGATVQALVSEST